MLMRYDPFRDADRFTEQLFGSPARAPHMALDAVRHGDEVVLRFDVPGVSPDSIDVNVERNVLTVKAERSWWPAEGDEILARERSHGTFSRQVFLGEALDPERLEASYDQGVLTLRVPVADKAKPRKVEVHVGSSERQPIEANTSN
jgi:HSP20 family protein